jgi:hypothetical protein
MMNMTVGNTRGNWLGSNLALGLLITLLSVFTALINYSTYKAGNEALDIKAEGDSRNKPFGDQYYTAMYKDTEDLFNKAFAMFDRAQVLDDKEGGFQFAMSIAAVGLSFAAYASLFEEVNRLRRVL